MTLLEYGSFYGTDKVAHGYMPHYERHLPEHAESVLELGVLNGSSLRMWADFYPEARIYGLDINPDCQRFATDRIEVHTASQDDTEALEELAERAGGFDVVIDDASHVNSLIVKSFDILWPHTRDLYVIEDLGNSYVDLTPHVSGWPGMQHNHGVDYRNDRALIDDFFTQRIYEVDDGSLNLHLYRDLAFLERT